MFNLEMLQQDVNEVLTLKTKRENCKILIREYLNDILDKNSTVDLEMITDLEYELNDLNSNIEYHENLILLNLTYNWKITKTNNTIQHISQLNDN